MDRFKEWKPPMFDKEGWARKRIKSHVHDEAIHAMEWYRGERYGWRAQYHEGLKLGKFVDIGCFTYMNAKYGIEIGDNVQIGAHCAIYSENTENNTQGKVVIGEESMIGSYTLILPGAVILPNSKIRARSIIK